MIMFRALLAISFASALAAPSVAQWDAVTYDPASAVHTEGFLIVHDDGSDLMAFSAMAQEWMPIAASGSQVLGTGDFCAAFRTTSGSLAAYSARLHACRTAPIPLGITMIDVQVADDVVLALYEYGGDVFALGYSTENNAWAQLALGAVPPSSLQYGAERFVAAVSEGSLLAGFAARSGTWDVSSNDSVLNLSMDGNVVVADVIPTPGAARCAAAFSGVLGTWSVSPPVHPAGVTALDHNVAWTMIDIGVGTAFHHGAYSAYTGSWVVSAGPFLTGNWSAQLSDNVVLMHDSLSQRFVAFGARPGNALVPVPSSGPWSLVLLGEDGVVLDDLTSQDLYGLSGLSGTAFVPRSVVGSVTAINGPAHSLHVLDGADTMHSFGPAQASWAAGITFGPTASVSAEDAVQLVEDSADFSQYSTRHNSWATGPPKWPGATYSVAVGGSLIAIQEDLVTSGEMRVFNELWNTWTAPFPQSAMLDMHAGRNLILFVDSSTGAASAYSAQTNAYTAPPAALTTGVLAPGSLPTVEENVAWFQDGTSLVAYGSPGEIHSWYAWPRGTEYQVWSGATTSTLDSSLRTDGPHMTAWLGSMNLLTSAISFGLNGDLWLGGFTIFGPQVAQSYGPGTVYMAHSAFPLPAFPGGARQVWSQGYVRPTLPGWPLSWWLTGPYAEPAWVF